MLKLNNVSMSIDKNVILQNISFDVKKGEFISIVGANGSGKSTLVKTITKNYKNYYGVIEINSKDLNDLNNKSLAKFLSTFSQHHESVEELTVYDIACFGRVPHKKTFATLSMHDYEIIDNVLDDLELTFLKNRVISTLSGGELQRTYLAACLIQQPSFLILDEPTNHLDIKHQYNILSLVKKYCIENDVTVLCILHDLNQAMKYGDKIIIMDDGKVHSYGKPMEIISEELIEEVFEVKSKIHRDKNEMHVDFLM